MSVVNRGKRIAFISTLILEALFHIVFWSCGFYCFNDVAADQCHFYHFYLLFWKSLLKPLVSFDKCEMLLFFSFPLSDVYIYISEYWLLQQCYCRSLQVSSPRWEITEITELTGRETPETQVRHLNFDLRERTESNHNFKMMEDHCVGLVAMSIVSIITFFIGLVVNCSRIAVQFSAVKRTRFYTNQKYGVYNIFLWLLNTTIIIITLLSS